MWLKRSKQREISPEEFRSKVLGGKDDWRTPLVITGDVTLSGMKLPRRFSLSDSTIKGHLFLANSALEDGLNLFRVQIEKGVDLSGAELGRPNIFASRIQNCIVGEDVILANSTLFAGFDFEESKILGNLQIDYATVGGGIGLENLLIGGNLSCADLTWKEEGELYLQNTIVEGDCYAGEDVELAMQLFLYFGKRVRISSAGARRMAASLQGKGSVL